MEDLFLIRNVYQIQLFVWNVSVCIPFIAFAA